MSRPADSDAELTERNREFVVSRYAAVARGVRGRREDLFHDDVLLCGSFSTQLSQSDRRSSWPLALWGSRTRPRR
jgi:hypothetical protein